MKISFYFGVGALVLGALDAAAALAASASMITAGTLWLLDALTGVLLGALVAVFLALGDAIRRSSGGRLPRALIDGFLAALLAVPLGLALFSGHGVSRTPLGRYGPYVLPFAAMLLAACGSLALRGLLAGADGATAGRRLGLAAVFAIAAAAVFLTDRGAYPGLYTYLHVLLALGGLALLGVAVCLLTPKAPSASLPAWFVATIAALSLPLLFHLPVPNDERPIVLEDSLVASRTAEAVWYLADLDRDGFSPLLGGGDCNDFDASVNPIALDITRNGTDEDCDGSDPTPFYAVETKPSRTDRRTAARIAAAAAGHPTVVIVVDALRADRVGLPRFPNLARLAGDSINFEHAYSAATRTTWSIPTIMIGRSVYDASESTIAERMSAAGKSTALVTIEHVVLFLDTFGGPGFSLKPGFDKLEIVPSPRGEGSRSWDWLGAHVNYWTGSAVTERLISLLDGPSPPDFVWVHYYDLHQYGHLRIGDPGATPAERYDAVLEALDAELKPLLERADRLNIVLIADHGEHLGEEGLFHGGYLHRDLVRVPLLIRVPGISPARLEVPVSVTDLAPTLYELLGLSGDEAWMSRSLLGLVGVADPGPRPPILMFESGEWSIIEGKWRLVLRRDSGVARLYDLDADPEETRNLADREPRVTARLSTILRQLAALARQDHPRYPPLSGK